MVANTPDSFAVCIQALTEAVETFKAMRPDLKTNAKEFAEMLAELGMLWESDFFAESARQIDGLLGGQQEIIERALKELRNG